MTIESLIKEISGTISALLICGGIISFFIKRYISKIDDIEEKFTKNLEAIIKLSAEMSSLKEDVKDLKEIIKEKIISN